MITKHNDATPEPFDELYFRERGISDGLTDACPAARNNPHYMAGYDHGLHLRRIDLRLKKDREHIVRNNLHRRRHSTASQYA